METTPPPPTQGLPTTVPGEVGGLFWNYLVSLLRKRVCHFNHDTGTGLFILHHIDAGNPLAWRENSFGQETVNCNSIKDPHPEMGAVETDKRLKKKPAREKTSLPTSHHPYRDIWLRSAYPLLTSPSPAHLPPNTLPSSSISPLEPNPALPETPTPGVCKNLDLSRAKYFAGHVASVARLRSAILTQGSHQQNR